MTVNTALDEEWLAHSLSMDATYIARLHAAGKHEEAAEYMRRVDYVNRMNEWKQVRA